MNKEIELKKAKQLALMFLLGAAVIFVLTVFMPVFMPRNAWVDAIKAISEAAMVGALADWFAVVALFRKVPLPLISSHTAIIPKNKDKIADNLAIFIQDKFLDVQSIVGLIRKHDPAQKIAQWLAQKANADRVGGYLVQWVSGILGLVEDDRIQHFFKQAIYAAIEKVDLSKSAGMILDHLTKDGRHQELLDEAIGQVVALLGQPETGAFISRKIIDWLKTEHPLKEKVLPSEWIGENGAALIANAASSLLSDVGRNPSHQIRANFDAVVQRLIARLKTDPAFLEKGEEIKQYLKDDEKLNAYTRELWGELYHWLKRDLASDESLLHRKIVESGQWVGHTLASDPELRASLNSHMEAAAHKMAPDFARFLTRHISDTVKNWDARELSWQIEMNIGKDLQYIRINGTIAGGLIGLGLYGFSQLPDVLRAFWT